ncbi:MAG: YgiT-type zinc finger protein [Cyanobacteria bacterium P01_F01_bin.53]
MSSDNRCENCGSKAFHVERISEVFDIDGRFCVVEEIPAMVCDRCGEELFSSETSEHIRVMLRGVDKPLRSVSLDVFSFQEAV